MSSETVQFEHGTQTYRIQYEVVAPPPQVVKRPGEIRGYMPPPEFKVASIRVIEITPGVAEGGAVKSIVFGRGFATLAQARTGATEYAKRIIREQLSRKLVPEPVPTPVV